jgi:hypothetical protein
MSLLKIFGKLWYGNLTADLEQLGKNAEQKILDSLDLAPIEKFNDLLDLKNLKGDSTGYLKAYTGDKIDRVSLLSIDIMPGMRYINLHVIPDHHYMVPRFSYEGMVTTKGSLMSADLYADIDPIMQYDFIDEKYQGVEKIYAKAKKHKSIELQASRLPHMRAMCSPYFLRAGKVSAEDVVDFENIALGYFDEWLSIFKNAPKISEEEAADRLKRRQHMAHVIQTKDPDRAMVVKIYGEETTLAIEKASLL